MITPNPANVIFAGSCHSYREINPMPSFLSLVYVWLDKLSTIRLDEVSLLQRISRDGYKYIENDHEVIVQVELQSGEPNVIIYSTSIDEWLPPYNDEKISSQVRESILAKVCLYLQRRNVTYRVQ